MEDAPSCGEKGPPVRSPVKNGPCVNVAKCGAEKSFAETRQRRLCRPCFAESVEHAFRKGMQLCKPIRRSQPVPVVLAYSGGLASTALCHLFAMLEQQDARKVHFAAHVVWVDCLDVLDLSPEEKESIRSRVASQGARFASFRRFPLCAAFSRGSLEPDEDGACMKRLLQVFSGNRPMVSWKEGLLELLTRSIIVRYAQKIGSHRVILGESMTRVCVNLFGTMARGVGSNSAATVGPVDATSFGDVNVMILRPLVSLTQKEIALYLRSLPSPVPEVISVPTFATLAKDKKHSLNLLSETFLLALQDAHDHTLPTLTRAANKIVPPDGATYCKEWANCMGCDPDVKKAILAGAASSNAPSMAERCAVCHSVSAVKNELLQQEGDECCSDTKKDGDAGCGCKVSVALCRRCQLLTREMETDNGSAAIDVVVPYRDEVRASIAEYLLSSSEDE